MQSESPKIPNKKTLTGILLYAAVFFTLVLISYTAELTNWTLGILNLFRPVIMGLVLAYLCNPIFRFLERRFLYRLHPSALRRVLSLLLSYVLIFAVVVLCVLLILPQLTDSATLLIANYESYVSGAISYINGVFTSINGFFETFIGPNELFHPISGSQFFETLYNFFSDVLLKIKVSDITAIAGEFVSILADIIFAIFISIYLLSSKEKRYVQVMKFRRAMFSDRVNKRITQICTNADHLFGKFLEGKLFDSLIVGVLTYISLALMSIEYAILIAAFIAVMNIIPYIGFLIGMLSSCLIVILTSPESFLPFLLVMFVIYQIDINIITPKILGDNTGVSALCIIISISIMGRLWGFIGMILAVPLFGTILKLADSLIHQRLQCKRSPDDVENYYAPDTIAPPSRIGQTSTSRWVQNMEKRVLRTKAKQSAGSDETVTRTERLNLCIYNFGRKINILKETPPTVITQFAAEEAQLKIRRQAKESAQQTDTATPITKTETPTEEGEV